MLTYLSSINLLISCILIALIIILLCLVFYMKFFTFNRTILVFSKNIITCLDFYNISFNITSNLDRACLNCLFIIFNFF